jgi:hypothetical protein
MKANWKQNWGHRTSKILRASGLLNEDHDE